ncbi:MAG: zinc-dependent metalloprotease [Planctomycetales bacterium]|nr:zinc-dependent metalloprotease [Planctomycetales bacterium]
MLAIVSLSFATALAAPAALWAEDAQPEKEPQSTEKSADEVSAVSGSSSSSGSSAKASDANSDAAKYAAITKDAKSVDGLIKLHRNGSNLYAELNANQLNKDFIVLISIAKGIGQRPLLGGMTWGFGDDWLWQFRKVDERIQLVRRNVRFKAKSGSPEEKAVKLAYTDSVLFSLPIAAKTSGGAYVVDLSPVFMSDLPQISMVLPGFVFSAAKSNWAEVKGFKDNIELEVEATYASAGMVDFESVPDSRGVTVNVHYSISMLPTTGYTPRLADDRVGYFLTVLKDYSKPGDDDRFVRYINRWDLQKADASADLSPPKAPIVFWLEKTIPFKYRKPIREGILEWNKAFEKAGFANAIEVRQQPDDADWDPEDINYNSFRWITSGAGFAMGPSRVNPYNGQILDADIIFDSDFLNYWKMEYETFTPAGIEQMTGGPNTLEGYHAQQDRRNALERSAHRHSCKYCQGQSHQLALSASVFAARTQSPEDLEKLIMQALKDVTMHEVGHTLGLRHNFKASTYYSLADLNDPNKTSKTGISASVMDYTPVNMQPKDANQGDYYSTTIGPYDYWAIEYGYKTLSGGTDAEVEELKKIASRSGEPELAYATDEDTRGIDPDPLTNRFDLGNDGVAYAKLQAQIVAEIWPTIVDKAVEAGDGYQDTRRAFGVLLGTHGRSMYFAARYVGGLVVNRSHKGDDKAKPPIEVVGADKQREALQLLEEQLFSEKPFNFPPELYNHLAASHWNHWGTMLLDRPDYPVHDVIAMWQDRVLSQLMSPLTLSRLYDSELKVPADQDAFTTAELLDRLTKVIFAEADTLKEGEFTNRKPAVSSIRRNLQRIYLKRLSTLAMYDISAPQDCQTLAYSQLNSLEGRLQNVLKSNVKLDAYTKAHFEESASRIRKVIDARLELVSP